MHMLAQSPVLCGQWLGSMPMQITKIDLCKLVLGLNVQQVSARLCGCIIILKRLGKQVFGV